MTIFNIKAVWAVLVTIILLVSGCQDFGVSQKADSAQNDARLAGTWRQIRLNQEDVTDVEVKLTIADHTLTMQAPGCLISGAYTTADDHINFIATVARGNRCAIDQENGKRQKAQYKVTASQLILSQSSNGMQVQKVFERIVEMQSL